MKKLLLILVLVGGWSVAQEKKLETIHPPIKLDSIKWKDALLAQPMAFEDGSKTIPILKAPLKNHQLYHGLVLKSKDHNSIQIPNSVDVVPSLQPQVLRPDLQPSTLPKKLDLNKKEELLKP